MKILYVITKSESGGAQTHVAQLSGHMRALGHQVAVMAYPGGPLESNVASLGIPFLPNRFLANTFNVFAGFRAMREIRRAISSFAPDVVSLHSSAAGFWGRLAARNRVPTVFTAHGWGFTDGTHPVRKAVVLLAERIVARMCGMIICVSHNDRALAIRYGVASPDRLVVVHNGVELPARPLTTDAFELPAREILFVGRLADPKQPDVLLRAYHRLPEPLRDRTLLTFIGDGPQYGELVSWVERAGLQSNVRFLGEMPRNGIFSCLLEPVAAKVLVLVSRYEGLPRSILEAMSCGLPIITSDVGGVREMVDATNGVLVARGDRDGLVSALESLLSDPERMSQMGRRSREKVEDAFTLPVMFGRTLDVYDTVRSSWGQ